MLLNLSFLLLVFFPLLLGGVWYRNEHLHLEYTQAGPAAFVLALVIWWLQQKNPKITEEIFFLRQIKAFWQKWKLNLASPIPWLLASAYVFFSLLWFGAALARHRAFSSGAADLGIFTNGLWNFIQGNGYISSVKNGLPLLADHQSYFALILAPFFALFPQAETLLFLQALGLASGGIALYLLAKQYCTKENPFLPLVPFFFWVYLPIRNANLFDFHPEIFLLPLFLFSIWLLQENTWRKRISGALFFLLALSTKESAGPVAVGVGIAWLLGAAPMPARSFTKKFAYFAVLSGSALFLFNVKIVPSFFQETYGYASVYGELGSNPLEILLSPFTHPLLFLERILGFSRLKFLFSLLAPLAFLPLLFPRALPAALPGLLMIFLTLGNQRVSTGFHYAIEPAVGILWAFAGALQTKWLQEKKIFFFFLAWWPLFFLGRSEAFQIRYFLAKTEKSWIRQTVVPALSPTASLAAPSALVPHLATRPWIHFLPEIQTKSGQPVDCIIWLPTVNNTPLDEAGEKSVRLSLAQSYTQEYFCPPTQLEIWRHKNFQESCLSQVPTCPPKP